jgi:Transcriptional regulator
MGPHFNLNSIVTFLAVAQSGSFRAASERLHTSSSAVSARIKLLETRLDVRLFHRTTRSLSLTPAGERLLEAALNACSELAAVEQLLRQEASLMRGEVSIAVVPSLSQGDVPFILSKFVQEYPGIKVKLLDVDSRRGLEMLSSAQVDLAILSEPGARDRILFEPLFWDASMLVVPKLHPLATRSEVAIDELRDEPLMVNPRGTTFRAVLDQAFNDAGVRLDPAQEISTMPALVRMVQAGFGLGIAPSKALEGLAVEGCRIVSLKGKIGWTVGIARMASRSEAPASTALRNRLHSYYAAPRQSEITILTAVLTA